jgi:hypothetical protein
MRCGVGVCGCGLPWAGPVPRPRTLSGAPKLRKPHQNSPENSCTARDQHLVLDPAAGSSMCGLVGAGMTPAPTNLAASCSRSVAGPGALARAPGARQASLPCEPNARRAQQDNAQFVKVCQILRNKRVHSLL